MTTTLWNIQPRDPVVFRDGRPFSADPGAVARSMPLPLPSVVAGTIRTRCGKDAEGRFPPAAAAEVLKIQVRGPFPFHRRENEWLFPAPLDAFCSLEGKDGPRWTAWRPTDLHPGEGTTLPAGLVPLRLRRPAKGKPIIGPSLWPWKVMKEWLTASPEAAEKAAAGLATPATADRPHPEPRSHVTLDRATGTATEGHLFTTVGMRYPDDLGLVCEVASDRDLSGLHTIGGEGRTAIWTRLSTKLPAWPGEAGRHVRVILVTPAPLGAHGHGWCPEWLDSAFTGTPPGLPAEVRLTLRAAAIGRPVAASGWDLAKGGPKPTRWLAPAGSVFFFEVTAGQPAALAPLWLSSICQHEQDRRDGFGLVLIGTY